MTNKQPTRDIFCANEQQITPHTLDVDSNGEIVATCENCQRALKFPADMGKEDFEKALKAHEEHNTGQVTVESMQNKLRELIGQPGEEASPTEPTNPQRDSKTKPVSPP